MRWRRIAVSDVDRKKRGECRLCGRRTQLTKTHVPAQSAGNVGTAQAPTIETDEHGRETYGLAAERQGGINDYWFCAACNNRTRSWDECFTAWSQTLDHLLRAHSPRVGQRVDARIVGAASGPFVRCLWAWMFAITEGLRLELPHIASAVLSGEKVQPPKDPRLLLGVTLEDQISIVSGPHSGIVVAPPFVAFLVTDTFIREDWITAVRTGHRLGVFQALHFLDTGQWLLHSESDRQDVDIDVPIVEMGALPMLGENVWS